MRKLTVAAMLVAVVIPAGALAQMMGHDQMAGHGMTPDDLKWGPAPPALPPGSQVAVLSGAPDKEGLYVVRAKLPAGYKVPAHTHSQDEHVTVISGSMYFGMGAKLDESKGEKLPAGGYVNAAKGMQHFVWFTEPTVIQVHGMGPIDFTYVDPADDPRNKK
jgi:quercetin dioxygenase-like cupin family protein